MSSRSHSTAHTDCILSHTMVWQDPCSAISGPGKILTGNSVMCHDMSLNIEPKPLCGLLKDRRPGAAPPTNLPSIHAEGKVHHSSFTLDLQNYRVPEFHVL